MFSTDAAYACGCVCLRISSIQVTMWWKACATPSSCTPHGVSIGSLAEPLARFTGATPDWLFAPSCCDVVLGTNRLLAGKFLGSML